MKQDLEDLEETLRRPRKKRIKIKVVGKSIFKLRNLLVKKRSKQ